MILIKLTPHNYQKRAIRHIVDHPRAGLFLDMGLGKTVITLTALEVLRVKHGYRGTVLVIAPKRVVTDTWAHESQKWDHLQHLTVVPIVGTAKERIAAFKQDADIHLISRDNIRWLIETIGVKDWPYTCLIIDELSSFKNPQSKRFKALRKVTHKCDRVIGLTGTPAPNGYTDLWAQMFLLDAGERLGHTLTVFRRDYCYSHPMGAFNLYYVSDENRKKIDDNISDIIISMTAKDYLQLPPVSIIDHEVTLDKKAARAYETMRRDAVLELSDDNEIIGVNAAAVANKLLQLASGFIYDDNGDPVEVHSGKIDTLKEIVEAANGTPLLIFYQFKHDEEQIRETFPEAVNVKAVEDLSDWNAGNIPILLAHPASAGHGLNLQAGGHTIIWYGVPWSLELYEQANARLNRQGQKYPVMIHRILTADTLDNRVVQALTDKHTSQSALIDAVKAEVGL